MYMSERERYHDARFWKHWSRSLAFGLLGAFVSTSKNDDIRTGAMALGLLSVLSMCAAYLHTVLEARCCADDDCGDDHTMN